MQKGAMVVEDVVMEKRVAEQVVFQEYFDLVGMEEVVFQESFNLVEDIALLAYKLHQK